MGRAPNPRARRRESRDPQGGEWRQAACPHAVVADGHRGMGSGGLIRRHLRVHRTSAGGFPACRRWSRSDATTPRGTRVNVNPGIPAGMPAPGAGPGWHPSMVRRAMGTGDRWHRFAPSPATCRETLGFEQVDPMRSVLRVAKASFPCMGMPGFFGEGERMRAFGSIRLPIHPSPRPEP